MDSGFVLTVALLFIVFFIVYRNIQKGKRQKHETEFLRKLKNDYDTALRSGDKAKALELGRNYYRYKRNHELTIYDEQAIANDLSAMK